MPILFSFVLVATTGLEMSTPTTMESPTPDGGPENSSGKLPFVAHTKKEPLKCVYHNLYS